MVRNPIACIQLGLVSKLESNHIGAIIGQWDTRAAATAEKEIQEISIHIWLSCRGMSQYSLSVLCWIVHVWQFKIWFSWWTRSHNLCPHFFPCYNFFLGSPSEFLLHIKIIIISTQRDEASCKSDEAFRTITSQISTWWWLWRSTTKSIYTACWRKNCDETYTSRMIVCVAPKNTRTIKNLLCSVTLSPWQLSTLYRSGVLFWEVMVRKASSDFTTGCLSSYASTCPSGYCKMANFSHDDILATSAKGVFRLK